MMSAGSVTDTDQLIETLTAQMRPVTPLAAPSVRFAVWCAFAALIVAGNFLYYPLREDLLEQVQVMRFSVELAAAALTGLCAGYGAFMTALPDRPLRWAYLPLVPGAIWLASLGAGCYSDFVTRGADGFALGPSFHCFKFVSFTGLAMTLPLIYMLRHAARIRPGETAFLAGLASASLAAALLTLFHDLDTSLMVLVWHGSAITLLSCGTYLLRRPLLSAAERAAR